MAAQSDLLNAKVQVTLSSRARIAEATARVAKDVAQSIGERTQQRNVSMIMRQALVQFKLGSSGSL